MGIERKPGKASGDRCLVRYSRRFSRELALILIKKFRRTGCVTRLDAVPLGTSLKQGKRQKPVPHHRSALTGRKSSMGEVARASCSPLRLPGLGVLQSGFPLNRVLKSGLELQAGPDGAIL